MNPHVDSIDSTDLSNGKLNVIPDRKSEVFDLKMQLISGATIESEIKRLYFVDSEREQRVTPLAKLLIAETCR